MQVEVSDKALHLAKEWVKNMTGGEECDYDKEADLEAKFEIRPARLGLGAKFVPHSLVASTMTPVEKKLRAKIGASKQMNLVTSESNVFQAIDKSQLPEKTTTDLEDGEVSKASLFNKRHNLKCENVHSVHLESENKRKRKKKK